MKARGVIMHGRGSDLTETEELLAIADKLAALRSKFVKGNSELSPAIRGSKPVRWSQKPV